MNKAEIYELLDSCHIPYEVTNHKAVFNMAEMEEVKLPYPEVNAKNLFVRDDKKRSYYVISIKGTKKINLKEFRQKHGIRALSFASENELHSILGLEVGSVTPLGVLNDKECKVQVFIDEDFLEEIIPGKSGIIGIHPNENTATVWLRVTDLVNIIEEHGNACSIVEM